MPSTGFAGGLSIAQTCIKGVAQTMVNGNGGFLLVVANRITINIILWHHNHALMACDNVQLSHV